MKHQTILNCIAATVLAISGRGAVIGVSSPTFRSTPPSSFSRPSPPPSSFRPSAPPSRSLPGSSTSGFKPSSGFSGGSRAPVKPVKPITAVRPNRPVRASTAANRGVKTPAGTVGRRPGSGSSGVSTAAAAGAGGGALGALALYTIYSNAELTNSLNAWQTTQNDATGQPGAIQCSSKGVPADQPNFYARPRVECDGQTMEFFECGKPGYEAPESSSTLSNYCVRSDLKMIARDWHGSDFKYQGGGYCPSGFDHEPFGVYGAAIVHCWKECPAGYLRHYDGKYNNEGKRYWWCQRDCNSDAVKPKGYKVKEETADYCLYEKA